MPPTSSSPSSDNSPAKPADPAAQEARFELLLFLAAHTVFLDSVFTDRKRWLPRKRRRQMRDAWSEGREALRRAIDDLQHVELSSLQEAGLSGAQLSLKLDLWRAELHPAGSRLRRGWVGRTLRHANVIVGSLAGVIGVAEPVKELGELLGNVLERWADQA